MKQLSIIVPIYNVEKYVRQCMESIFRQGLDDDVFEVILVNDGTPDKSMEVIADITDAHHNILIIEQENQGLSITRNNGLQNATGQYILFVDSDDLLIEDSLPFFLRKAIESDADLVMADYLELREDESHNIPSFALKPFDTTVKDGESFFLEDINPYDCHVWHIFFKRAFLCDNGIQFAPNVHYEDILFTHEYAIKAKKCLRINVPVYIYRKGNTLSITSNFDKRKGMDFGEAIAKTWKLTHTEGLSPRMIAKLKDNMFVSFSTLICVVTHNIPIHSDRMDILNHIKQISPDMVFGHNIKQKFVSFLFRRIPSCYIFLRILYARSIEGTVWKIRRIYKRL